MSACVRPVQVLLALLFLLSWRVGRACLLRPLWYQLWEKCESLSYRLGLSSGAVACLRAQAMKFVPDVRIIDGKETQCYHHRSFANYMASSLVDCMRPSDISFSTPLVWFENLTSFDAFDDELPVPSESEEVLADDEDQKCSCGSGCHYCCLLVPVHGEDDCFDIVCRNETGFCEAGRKPSYRRSLLPIL